MTLGNPLPAPTPSLGPATKALQAGLQVSRGKSLELMDRPPTPSTSSGSVSEDLDSDEREPEAKRGKGSRRVVKKSATKPKDKPAAKQSATAGSTTPQVNTTPLTTVDISVSVESTVSTVAKKSRRTGGEQQTAEVKINVEELRRACVGAMTALLGEGFRFARRIDYEEVSQLIPLEKLRKMCVVSIKFCEVDERVYMAVRPFHRELNLNEAHSCMYLVQHGTEFGVDRSLMKKRFSDARAKGRMSTQGFSFTTSPSKYRSFSTSSISSIECKPRRC